MSRYSQSLLERARIQSIQTAAREHSTLGTNLKNRIDIFSIIQQKGIWIMFKPVGIYGACLTVGESVGIFLNSNHPPNLQRFTAAHEYGHLVMQHGSRFDNEEQILSQRREANEQEVEAQTFAAHFLMPPTLINATLSRRGLPSKQLHLTARDAYQLSLEIGVSYAALINHLVALKKVSREEGRALQRIQPREIKAQITGGTPLQDSWADVWAFDERDADRTITAHAQDELHIFLPEMLEENAPWSVSETTSNMALTLISANLEMSTRSEQSEGQELIYLRHMVFRASTSGQTQIKLHRQGREQETFHLNVYIVPKQEQGLYDQQKYLLG